MENKKLDYSQFKNGFKNYIGETFTGMVAVAIIVYSFVRMGLTNQIDESWITSFITGVIIMFLMISIWYPTAKQKASVMDADYKFQRSAYGALVDRVVETNNQKHLNNFCDWATEENRILLIKQKLIKLNIDYDVYLQCSKDLSLIQENDILTDKQKKGLRKLIENGVKVKKIIYTSILTGLKAGKIKYNVNSTETRYDVFKIILKVIVSISLSIGMAFVVFTFGGFTWSSVAQIIIWYVIIIWNVFTTYSTGYKSVSVHRKNYYCVLKTFLEEFVSSEFYKEDGRVLIKRVPKEEKKEKEENIDNVNEIKEEEAV